MRLRVDKELILTGLSPAIDEVFDIACLRQFAFAADRSAAIDSPGITGQHLVRSFTGSLLEVVQTTRDFVLRGDVAEGLSPELVFAIRLALEEAVTNAHRHGHGGILIFRSQSSLRIGDDLILKSPIPARD